MTSDEIRTSFLEFFKQRGHVIERSDTLVPKNDPTLLFTSAGMVQFKPYYTGEVPVPYRRAATVQKCLRAGGKANDLDEVGKTARHLTFFEMLGNFSFGDYFKREAILWAWEYTTQVLRMPADDIWVSVFVEDDEAAAIWEKEIGLPPHKIARLGAKDNFWGPAGDRGACGPCSELHIDRGQALGCHARGDRERRALADHVEDLGHVQPLDAASRVAAPEVAVALGVERRAAAHGRAYQRVEAAEDGGEAAP